MSHDAGFIKGQNVLFGMSKGKFVDKLYNIFIFCIFLILHEHFALLGLHPYQRKYDFSLFQALFSALFDHLGDIIEAL